MESKTSNLARVASSQFTSPLYRDEFSLWLLAKNEKGKCVEKKDLLQDIDSGSGRIHGTVASILADIKIRLRKFDGSRMN